ncbi:HEAT repeat domain-containing protein [Candidatus Micrarchaeota archaeon]|nr:HEAT repeat domain-containing protein [Candidatus Micrarchaeota archaeon]
MKPEKPKGVFGNVSSFLARAFRRTPENKKPEGMPNEVWKHVQYLKHEDFNVRRNTAYALGEIKHESAVPFLIQTILKDKNQFVRGCAAEALGEIKHENAVKPLIQTILKDENQFAREKAAEALDKIIESLEEKQEQEEKLTPEGEKLLKAIALVKPHFLKDEYADVKARALHAAYNGEIDDTTARLLVKQLRAHEGNLK